MRPEFEYVVRKAVRDRARLVKYLGGMHEASLGHNSKTYRATFEFNRYRLVRTGRMLGEEHKN